MATERDEEQDGAWPAGEPEAGRPGEEPSAGDDDRASTIHAGLPSAWLAATSTWDAPRFDQIRAMHGRFDHIARQIAALRSLAVTRLSSPRLPQVLDLTERQHRLFADLGTGWPPMRWQGVLKAPAYLESLSRFASRAGTALRGLISADLPVPLGRGLGPAPTTQP